MRNCCLTISTFSFWYFSISFFKEAFSSCNCSIDLAISFDPLNASFTFANSLIFSLTNCNACSPHTASTLRTPAATALSAVILNNPNSPVAPTCVPPHNSILYFSSIMTTRTTSPYFSPNNAIAPNCIASSFDISLITTGMLARIFSFTIFSTCSISSFVIFAKCEKSKRKYSELFKEPFCAMCLPNTCCKAACSKCVDE